MIDHAEKYVDGQIHTNGLENYWSLLKRAIKGTYVSVEQAYRFNERKLTDAEGFALALSQIVGRRVTYKGADGQVR